MSSSQTDEFGVEGGCLCGAVRYRVVGRPLASIICHCETCRKASAAPSVAWLTFEIGHFRWLAGSPRRFQSSADVHRSFCGDCGSPLSYEKTVHPHSIDVTSVSLDEPARFPPDRELWLEDRVAWEARNAELAHYPRGSSEGPGDVA